MQILKVTPKTTSSYLITESLKTLSVSSRQDKIKKLVSEVKHCKAITLSTTLKGEYTVSIARERRSPSNQANIDHWHYSYTAKIDKDTANKRTFLSIVTKQLLDGTCEVIYRITWYVELTALSV